MEVWSEVKGFPKDVSEESQVNNLNVVMNGTRTGGWGWMIKVK